MIKKRIPKAQLRAQLVEEKLAKARKIPFSGRLVSKSIIKRMKYLASKNLPHSETIAAVPLPKKVKIESTPPLV